MACIYLLQLRCVYYLFFSGTYSETHPDPCRRSGRNMGSVGNVSTTLRDRYSRGARGPYESGFCSPCRGCHHTVRLLVFTSRISCYMYVILADLPPSAYPSESRPTMPRDKPGSPTLLTPQSHYTSSGRAFHMARRAKTCSTCFTPTPLQSRGQFGFSVSLAQMR